jgi:hypothetical protein
MLLILMDYKKRLRHFFLKVAAVFRALLTILLWHKLMIFNVTTKLGWNALYK